MSAILLVEAVADGVDPITAFLTKDWVNLGAWSMLIITWTYILLGAVKEWWVPGARYRRLEEAAKLQSETLATTAGTLEKQVTANEITKHFFEETAPRRREAGTS